MSKFESKPFNESKTSQAIAKQMIQRKLEDFKIGRISILEKKLPEEDMRLITIYAFKKR